MSTELDTLKRQNAELLSALRQVAQWAKPHPDDTDADRKRYLRRCESIANRVVIATAKGAA